MSIVDIDGITWCEYRTGKFPTPRITWYADYGTKIAMVGTDDGLNWIWGVGDRKDADVGEFDFNDSFEQYGFREIAEMVTRVLKGAAEADQPELEHPRSYRFYASFDVDCDAEGNATVDFRITDACGLWCEALDIDDDRGEHLSMIRVSKIIDRMVKDGAIADANAMLTGRYRVIEAED